MPKHETDRARGAVSATDRRRDIIDAAMEVIADNGLEGATIAKVAKAAGVAVGTVALHFDTKENLFAEIVTHLIAREEAHWARITGPDAGSAADRLALVLTADLSPERFDKRSLSVWFAFFGEQKFRDIYRDRAEEHDKFCDEVIYDLIVELKEDGNYTHIDPWHVADILAAFCDGLDLDMLLYDDIYTAEAARQNGLYLLTLLFPKHYDFQPTAKSTW